jgi:DNA polymerase-3 subunit delta'
MATLIHSLTSSQVDAVKRTHSGSYIFHGPSGMGKSRLAHELAREINCLGDSAGLCARCKLFAADAYPDLILLGPEDKASIGIPQAKELVRTLSLSPYYAQGTRVVLVEEAHLLTTEAQNALLKIIEEPPAHTIFILITDRIDALLPTIQSRCAAIYFPQVTESEIASFLARDHNIKPSDAAGIAAAAEGAPGIAVMLATQPDETKSRLELRAMAVTAAEAQLFDRLVLARRLTESKADLQRFGRALHSQLVGQLRAGETSGQSAARRMEALERFRRHLVAKVSPRVALERLMLEL